MIAIIKQWLTAKDKERGQGLVEYSLIMVLVAVVVIVVLAILGEAIEVRYHNAYSQIRCAHRQSEINTIWANQGNSIVPDGGLAFMRINDGCVVVASEEYDMMYDQFIRELGQSPQ
ncbi:MAG: hypothetical protein AAFU54_24260 [Chloroflexota bacterium]